MKTKLFAILIALSVAAIVQAQEPAAVKLDRYGDRLPEKSLARLGTVRLRQGQIVEGVAFSPDGKFVASCGQDLWIRIWDVATGRPVSRFPIGNPRGTNGIAFSPDGTKLASVDKSGYVSLWNFTSGELISRTEGHKDNAFSVAFAPDGAVFATGGSDGQLRVWDALTAKPVLNLKIPGDPPSTFFSLAFSPDGSRLAAPNRQGTIYVLNMAGGGEPLVIPTPLRDGVSSLSFSADGKQLTSGGTRSVRSGPGPLRSVPEIYVWSAVDGKLQFDFKTDEALAGDCTFAMSADRATLVSVHFDKLIIWDVASRQPRHIVRTKTARFVTRSHGVAISPDGKLIATKAGGLGSNKIYFWDATSGEPVFPQDDTHGQDVITLSLSPDGKFIATGSIDESVRLWDAATGEHVRKISTGTSWVRYVEFFPDGERLAIGQETKEDGTPGYFGEVIIICRVADGQVLHHFPVPDRAMCGALSPDGKLLAIGIGMGGLGGRRGGPLSGCQLIVWDTDRGQQLAEIKGTATQYRTLSFSPRGDELWSFSTAGRFQKWNPTTGEELQLTSRPAVAPSGTARVSAFAPSSGDIAISYFEGSRGDRRGVLIVRPLNSDAPRWQKTFDERCWAEPFSISPDGRTLVAQLRSDSGVNNRILLLDMADGRELTSFHVEDNRARSFLFSSDGKRLFTGMEKGDVLMWGLTTAQ